MAKPEIWILEDDPSCQFVYRSILSENYECCFFEDLNDFISALVKRPNPKFLIADLVLKQSNFIDFFSRKESELLNTNFMVVSGLDELDILRDCYEEGALDYITKPFNKNQLRARLERYLGMPNVVDQRGPAKALASNMRLDHRYLKAHFMDRDISLTHKECQILASIKDSESITKDNLLKCVWSDVKVGRKTLDVHIFNLRKKLRPLGLSIQFEQPNLYRMAPLD